MPRVLQVAHLLGVPFSIPQGDLGATVGRAVVHQQEFPVIVALGQYALDRFLDEPLLIEEGSDYRDRRLVLHLNSPSRGLRLPIAISLAARSRVSGGFV